MTASGSSPVGGTRSPRPGSGRPSPGKKSTASPTKAKGHAPPASIDQQPDPSITADCLVSLHDAMKKSGGSRAPTFRELRHTQEDSIAEQAETELRLAKAQSESEFMVKAKTQKDLSPRAQKIRDVLDSFYRTKSSIAAGLPGHHDGTAGTFSGLSRLDNTYLSAGSIGGLASPVGAKTRVYSFERFERHTFGEKGFSPMADHFRIGGILHPGHGLEGGRMPEPATPHMEWVQTFTDESKEGVLSPKKVKKKPPLWCKKPPVLIDYARTDASVGIPDSKVYAEQRPHIEKLLKQLSCRRTVYAGAVYRPQTVTQEAYESSLGYGGPGTYGIPKGSAILSNESGYTNHKGRVNSLSEEREMFDKGCGTTRRLHPELDPAESYRLGSVFNNTILQELGGLSQGG
eukprot:g15724.t1